MDSQLALHAEQALLGALLLDNRAWDRVGDRLTGADFMQLAHRHIWSVIAEQLGAGNGVDPLVVATELERRGQLDTLGGGMSYLGLLVSQTASAANAVSYAERVREQSIRRQLAAAATTILDATREAEGTATEILETAAQSLGAIADQSQRGRGVRTLGEIMGEVVEYLDVVCASETKLLGQSTGYADLDQRTAGLQPGDLIILAARPSMGKSTLAINLAEHVAIGEGRPALVFSLEMTARSLGLRMAASQGRLDFDRLRRANLDEGEWARFVATTARVSAAPLRIDDTPALSLTEIAARARRARRELGGLALIVVDYLQLVQVAGRTENRNLEVAKVSQGLKALAKGLEVPVVALSQLSRAVEQRSDKRPMMSDLRDSGGIEQDADLIAFIYRDEVYHKDSPDKGTAEIIIAKQRNGPVGTVRLAANLLMSRFDDLAADWRPESPEPRAAGRRGQGPVYDY